MQMRFWFFDQDEMQEFKLPSFSGAFFFRSLSYSHPFIAIAHQQTLRLRLNEP